MLLLPRNSRELPCTRDHKNDSGRPAATRVDGKQTGVSRTTTNLMDRTTRLPRSDLTSAQTIEIFSTNRSDFRTTQSAIGDFCANGRARRAPERSPGRDVLDNTTLTRRQHGTKPAAQNHVLCIDNNNLRAGGERGGSNPRDGPSNAVNYRSYFNKLKSETSIFQTTLFSGLRCRFERYWC